MNAPPPATLLLYQGFATPVTHSMIKFNWACSSCLLYLCVLFLLYLWLGWAYNRVTTHQTVREESESEDVSIMMHFSRRSQRPLQSYFPRVSNSCLPFILCHSHKCLAISLWTFFVHNVNKSQHDRNTIFNGSLAGWYKLEHFLLDGKEQTQTRTLMPDGSEEDCIGSCIEEWRGWIYSGSK